MFYVGMTRAKERLHIYYAKEKYGKVLQLSRFVEELKNGGQKNGGSGKKNVTGHGVNSNRRAGNTGKRVRGV